MLITLRNLILPLVLLVFCAITDLRTKQLPALPLLLFGISGILLFVLTERSSGILPMLRTLFLCSLPGILLFSLSKVTGGAVGEGDGLLLLSLGSLLPLPDLLSVLLAALFTAAAAGVVLLLFFHRNVRSSIPFAPFLLIGFLVVTIFERSSL